MSEHCADKNCPGCRMTELLEGLLDTGFPEELLISMTLDVLGEVMLSRGHLVEFNTTESNEAVVH